MKKDVVILVYLTAWIVMLAGGIYFSLMETAHRPISLVSDFSAQQRTAPQTAH